MWLYAKNRVAEAEQIIRNAAKLNNITMPDKILVHPVINVTVKSEVDGKKSDDDDRKKRRKMLNSFRNQNIMRKSEKTENRSARYSVVDIFRNRRLTINIFCITLMWSVKSSTCCITVVKITITLLKSKSQF